jgi:hypothetical protein
MLKWLVASLVVLLILAAFVPRPRRTAFVGGSVLLSLLVWGIAQLL